MPARHSNRSYRPRRTPRAWLVATVLALLLPAACHSGSSVAPMAGLASSADLPTCLGRTAPEWQAMGYQIRLGTDGNDVLNASWQRTVIIALDGDDTLNGGTSEDILCGGAGDDTLNGYGGINTLVGGHGNDRLNGGPRRDHLIGGEVIDGGPAAVPNPPEYQRPSGWYAGIAAHLPDPWGDRMYLFGRVFDCHPTDGDDLIYEYAGGAGEERNVPTRLWGCAGNDTLIEGDGDGYLHGGEGDDTLFGEPGNDWLSGGPGADHCDGGLHQGNTNGVWAAIDAAIDGTCETVVGVP